MSYSWRLPSPPGGGSSSPSSLGTATTRANPLSLGGLFDQYIDPVTLDYVDTANGEWLETADSRTAVMTMIELRLGEDIYAPGDGTRIKALLENANGDPLTADQVIDEVLRALQLLVDAGTIGEVSAAPDVDQRGGFVLVLRWRDLATSSPVDLVYTPFQG